MTGIAGLRGTGQFTTDFRPTNYRELYTLLEPNGSAPLNALLAMMGSESTDDFKYNNFRDELPARVFTVDHVAGYNTSDTSIQLTSGDDVAFIMTGTLLVNVNTGEILQADADADTATYIATFVGGRNIGSTSLSITDGDVLAVVGSAFAQGGNGAQAISFDASVAYNYTQIFKTAYSITGSMQKTFFRTGDKEQEYSEKALKLHMGEIERSMFFGKRHLKNSSSATPTAYTGGLFTTLSQVEDVSAYAEANVMDEETFDRLLIESVFAFGGSEKVMFAGAKVAGHLQLFGKNRWNPTVLDNTYGVNITRYMTFCGSLNVILHPQFRQIPTLDETAVVLDMQYLKYRYMAGRDTDIKRNIQDNDADLVKHQYLTDCGLELTQDKPHTVIKNWTYHVSQA